MGKIHQQIIIRLAFSDFIGLQRLDLTLIACEQNFKKIHQKVSLLMCEHILLNNHSNKPRWVLQEWQSQENGEELLAKIVQSIFIAMVIVTGSPWTRRVCLSVLSKTKYTATGTRTANVQLPASPPLDLNNCFSVQLRVLWTGWVNAVEILIRGCLGNQYCWTNRLE